MEQNTVQNPVVSSLMVMTEGQELILKLETYIEENYQIRYNNVADKLEYRIITEDAGDANAEADAVAEESKADTSNINKVEESEWKTLDKAAFNTIVLNARKQGIDGNIRQILNEMIYSDNIPQYDPAKAMLDSLPAWDGKDRLEALFQYLPGITAEQTVFACKWFRSMVAHWYGMDDIYGNQSVLTLIGKQGSGKSVFLKQLLPPQLQGYFLDHINLAHKAEKEMALANNMIVNIDELDKISKSQQANLKQVITKGNVNARKLWGTNQTLRRRVASFSATTDNPHPLKDPAGSRRFLCIKLTKGKVIDTVKQKEIEYEQIFAQALFEVKEQHMPYWFNHEETERIQQLNMQFYQKVSFDDIVSSFVSKPKEDENAKMMTTTQIINMIAAEYPDIVSNKGNQTKVGAILKQMGIECKRTKKGNVYRVALPKSA